MITIIVLHQEIIHGNNRVKRAGFKYTIKGTWSSERLHKWLEENNVSTTEEAKCSQREDAKKCCSVCTDYIQSIYSRLKKADVARLQIYQPYIASVTKHWYRDVYFVAAPNQMFVDYDYDYEALMKERWTLYETYGKEDGDKEGEYKLYTTDGNLFDGTAEDAEEQGIKVTKKAITRSIGSMAEDLDWVKLTNGHYSAYTSEDNTTTTDYEPAYPDLEEDDPDYDIKKDIFVKISLTGTVKQTGEGQRTETNEKIKKMFLENEYFRYDGSAKTADAIINLRKAVTQKYNSENDGDDISSYYGPMKGTITINGSETKEVDYSDVTVNVDGKDEKVSDYIGTVSLNQDSLNAFSMLENEHTLDADYIYRDFKELIVELGYFTKEELTDETPRLLEFLVPEIGSYLYPRRSIDKNENEAGTMIHSKGDIKAQERNSLMELIETVEENTPEGETSSDDETQTGTSTETESTAVLNKKNKTIAKKGLLEMSDTSYADVNVVSDVNLLHQIVGSAESEAGARTPEDVSVEEFLEAADLVHQNIEDNGFEYKQGEGDQSCYESALASARKTDCSAYVSWVLQEVEILGPRVRLNTAGMYASELLQPYTLTKEEAGELQPGDIVLFDGTDPAHPTAHVQINGENNMQYNAGSTGAIQSRPKEYMPKGYTHVIRLFDKHGTADKYEGYLGNEAVVSPVTGILLEYDTYTGNEWDSITKEKYRMNVDLKYPPNAISSAKASQEGNSQSENQEGQTQIDKVGRAKILVLDEENYLKLATRMSNYKGCRFSGKTFLTNSGTFTDESGLSEDKVDDWSDIDKTLYGYKEFAERYKEAGISGYVVYIDGFKLELPDEEFDNENKKQLESESPKGEAIDINTFKETTLSNIFDSKGNVKDKEKLVDSLYERDEEYKLASKKATENLEAECITEDEAVSSIYLPDEDLVFIKEGTVLGRTLTDYELIVDYRNQSYEDFRKTTTSSKTEENTETNETNESKENDEDKIIGNYLRIIMHDLTKTKEDTDVVENVEDYMKLDTGEEGENTVDQEYQAWEGDLEILAEGIHHEAGYDYLAAKSQKFRSDPKEADFEMYCMGYSIVNKLLEQNEQWYGHLYDKSKTDISPLAQVLTSDWYATGTREAVENILKGGQGEYTQKELEYAEYCLTYDCTNQSKPYPSNLSSATKRDGYTTTSAGSEIPRAMCQQGGYGDGAPGQSNIILVGYWDHNNNNEFDKGDELWGVDRKMEKLIREK